ncbi:MAG: dihydropteroate synthase [Desulfobacteraceae bacterium]
MSPEYCLEWGQRRLVLGPRTLVMGVLNVTPDSFADGGRFFEKDRAIDRALEMASQGADIIDVGGESTRPYSGGLPEDEELERVIPVIEAVAGRVDVPLSIDTYKAGVARAALEAGASMINDVSGLRFDPDLGRTAAQAGVPLILMHMKGTPGDMQDNPTYQDLLGEIKAFLQGAVERAVSSGVSKDMILVDPGIGFGKSVEHNLRIIRDLGELHELGHPVVLGCSRKSFIGRILGKDPDFRDIGTMGVVSVGVINGAHVVRVHNVEMALDAVRVVDAIRQGRMPCSSA